MSSNNLTAKLAKELKRNTKKTAILALLCGVALWFWAPLVWGWLGWDEQGDVASEVPSNPTTQVTVAQPANVTAVAAPDLGWRKLTDLFSHHQLMKTAELQLGAAAPFGRTETQVAANETENVEEAEETSSQVAPAAAARPSPKDLGLKLTSTVTGRRTQLAVINGKTCHVGSVLVVPYRDQEIELKLVEVRPDVASLFDGQEMHLLTRDVTNSQIQLSAAMTMHAPERKSPDRIRIDAGYRD